MAGHPSRRSRILFLATNIEQNYGYELLAGAVEAAAAANADLVMPTGRTISLDTGFNYQHNVIFRMVGAKSHFDGVIMTAGVIGNMLGQADLESLFHRFEPLPIVTIGQKLPGAVSVMVDNHGPMRELVSHFIKDHGCRNIAWLAGPPKSQDAAQRREAFIAALADHGLGFDPGHEIPGILYVESGIAAARHIAENLRGSIDGVLAANDYMAMGMMEELSRLGITVPEELAVAGFDDFEATLAKPVPLTTIRQPARAQGRAALEACLQVVAGKTVADIVMPARLILRGSCGCPPSFISDMLELRDRQPEAEAVRRQVLSDVVKFPGLSQAAFTALFQAFLDLDAVQLDRWLHDPVEHRTLTWAIERLPVLQVAGIGDFRFLSNTIDQVRSVLLRRFPADPERADCETLIHAARSILTDLEARVLMRQAFERDLPNQEIIQVLGALTDNLSQSDTMYQALVPRLKAMGITSCLIWLYPAPVIHEAPQDWHMPNQLVPVLRLHDGVLHPIRHPAKIQCQDYLDDLPFRGDRPSAYLAFPLYVREEQLGIIACDFQPEVARLYDRLVLEIGVAIKLSGLLRQQMEVEQRLRRTLRDLEHSHDALTLLSTTDELTGLLNRRGFMDHAERILSLGSVTRKGGILCFADMDGLKKINDTWGHDDGDIAIKAMAGILRKTFRSGDTIARLGGDEFTAIILEADLLQETVFQKRMERLLSDWNKKSEKPWQLGITLGAVEFVADENLTVSELLRHADNILYERKRHKRHESI
jgi:diguanylate cyclase (GGDEF)-like protein